MEKDLNRIRSAKNAVNKCYQQLEKASKQTVNQLFHSRHETVFQEINCLDCARCCISTGPLFTHTDIKRISKHLGLSSTAFEENYLRTDEDGDRVLQQLPCPFLNVENKQCRIYNIRPKACMEYPHTQHPDMRAILKLTRKNAEVCPAVARITWQLMQLPGLDAVPHKSKR